MEYTIEARIRQKIIDELVSLKCKWDEEAKKEEERYNKDLEKYNNLNASFLRQRGSLYDYWSDFCNAVIYYDVSKKDYTDYVNIDIISKLFTKEKHFPDSSEVIRRFHKLFNYISENKLPILLRVNSDFSGVEESLRISSITSKGLQMSYDLYYTIPKMTINPELRILSYILRVLKEVKEDKVVLYPPDIQFLKKHIKGMELHLKGDFNER